MSLASKAKIHAVIYIEMERSASYRLSILAYHLSEPSPTLGMRDEENERDVLPRASKIIRNNDVIKITNGVFSVSFLLTLSLWAFVTRDVLTA